MSNVNTRYSSIVIRTSSLIMMVLLLTGSGRAAEPPTYPAHPIIEAEAPQIDGLLNEPIWTEFQKMRLSASGAPGAPSLARDPSLKNPEFRDAESSATGPVGDWTFQGAYGYNGDLYFALSTDRSPTFPLTLALQATLPHTAKPEGRPVGFLIQLIVTAQRAAFDGGEGSAAITLREGRWIIEGRYPAAVYGHLRTTTVKIPPGFIACALTSNAVTVPWRIADAVMVGVGQDPEFENISADIFLSMLSMLEKVQDLRELSLKHFRSSEEREEKRNDIFWYRQFVRFQLGTTIGAILSKNKEAFVQSVSRFIDPAYLKMSEEELLIAKKGMRKYPLTVPWKDDHSLPRDPEQWTEEQFQLFRAKINSTMAGVGGQPAQK